MGLGLRDTSPEAEAFLIRRLREMTPEQKLRQICSLTRMARELARAGIRLRHPAAAEDEVRLRLAALTLGPELVRNVYGWDPEQEGF